MRKEYIWPITIQSTDLKAQRKLISEYERKAKKAADLYAALNYGKKRKRGTWYR